MGVQGANRYLSSQIVMELLLSSQIALELLRTKCLHAAAEWFLSQKGSMPYLELRAL